MMGEAQKEVDFSEEVSLGLYSRPHLVGTPAPVLKDLSPASEKRPC